MSIAALLQAAEFLERRDREAEHGYASLPVCEEHRSGSRRPKTKKTIGSRTTHNELEKNRRAHLRSCLEKLKDMVPLGPEASRHTTLGLLTKAKRFIKSLEDRDKKNSSHKEQLAREQRYLRRRLAQLRNVPRTLSESSLHAHATRADSLSSLESSSGVSTADRSPSSVSESGESHSLTRRTEEDDSLTALTSDEGSLLESDEVDVIGYTSNQSDSESLLSGHSADSGVGVAARRVAARSAGGRAGAAPRSPGGRAGAAPRSPGGRAGAAPRSPGGRAGAAALRGHHDAAYTGYSARCTRQPVQPPYSARPRRSARSTRV